LTPPCIFPPEGRPMIEQPTLEFRTRDARSVVVTVMGEA
jgi:hypothetical protein